MAKFDPRKLMEQAVAVMRQSVSEPRSDDKASPIVGAVLWRPDGTVETACRGELRYGDHAEYTLLERKNRNQKLDGAALFATLEPCAPGARREPKLSCAERIVLARIARVWVGIEDPDPTVDRKGIKHLQDNGVTVHMFDRDLQVQIRKENKAFFDQAIERATAALNNKAPKKIKLSRLEDTVATAKLDDLSRSALERYRDAANVKESIGSAAFNRRMAQQGLLKLESNGFIPTGTGLLLFGKSPRTAIRPAGLLATIHYSDGREETSDFDGPMVLVPDEAEKWFRDKLPNVIDRSHMQRQVTATFPFELVREAVVNALVHRDYDIAGAKCHLVVTPDTVTIKSPGGPLSPITLKQLQDLNAPMLSRNPELHYVFAQMGLAEERGLGLRTMKAVPDRFGLPLPTYTFEDPYLNLTLYRSSIGVLRALGPEILGALNKDESQGWEFLASRTSTTKNEYVKGLGFDDRKAQRHLKKFVELGILRRVGAGPSTSYEVVRA